MGTPEETGDPAGHPKGFCLLDAKKCAHFPHHSIFGPPNSMMFIRGFPGSSLACPEAPKFSFVDLPGSGKKRTIQEIDVVTPILNLKSMACQVIT